MYLFSQGLFNPSAQCPLLSNLISRLSSSHDYLITNISHDIKALLKCKKCIHLYFEFSFILVYFRLSVCLFIVSCYCVIVLACNSNITYADVFGPNYKMKAQLLACNSNITYADVFGPNYKMKTQLLACKSNIKYADVFVRTTR